jgi:DUF218 domain
MPVKKLLSFRSIMALAMICFVAPLSAQSLGAQDLGPHDKTMSRIFPLLDAMSRDARVSRALQASKVLSELAIKRKARIESVLPLCQPLPQCWVEALIMDEEEIKVAKEALRELQKTHQLGNWVERDIRPKGFANRFNAASDDELLAQAYEHSAQALNRILRVYALAEKPRYAEIDSTSVDPNSQRGKGLIMELMHQPELLEGKLFYSAPWTAAQLLLYLDQRENAGYFPNLDQEDNVGAITRAQKMNWSAYPYSAILVLGDGPEIAGMNLGPFGKLRVLQAVRLFKEKKAPFIVVSGGYVHPARTSQNEAVEMKKELIKRYGIAENAIIIEPFARHTTTNLRNTSRLLSRYQFPLDKPALVTSSKFHIDYCLSEEFTKRQLEELGYLSVKWGARQSPTALAFYPLMESLFVDAMDPLDP